MDSFDDLLSLFDGGVRLAVRARPGTNKPRPLRVVTVGDGQRALEVSVAAPPEDGKANKAICERLAKELGLKKAQLSIKTGASGRLKLLEIAGEPAPLREKLTAFLEGQALLPKT